MKRTGESSSGRHAVARYCRSLFRKKLPFAGLSYPFSAIYQFRCMILKTMILRKKCKPSHHLRKNRPPPRSTLALTIAPRFFIYFFLTIRRAAPTMDERRWATRTAERRPRLPPIHPPGRGALLPKQRSPSRPGRTARRCRPGPAALRSPGPPGGRSACRPPDGGGLGNAACAQVHLLEVVKRDLVQT